MRATLGLIRELDPVFNIEFRQVIGEIYQTPRGPTWNRLLSLLSKQTELSWSYVTRVQHELDQAISNSRADLDQAITDSRNDLSRQIDLVREGLQPLILFGVFLIAVTLIGVTFSVLLSLRDTPTAFIPNWVTSWGWIMLAIVISIATLATAAIGVASAIVFIMEAAQRMKRNT